MVRHSPGGSHDIERALYVINLRGDLEAPAFSQGTFELIQHIKGNALSTTMLWAWLLVPVVLASCSDEEITEDVIEDTCEDIAEDPCACLDESECLAADGCFPLKGQPLELFCEDQFDSSQAIFGQCSSGGGDTIETCAIDPETGRRYLFPTSPKPDGWLACELDCDFEQCAAGMQVEADRFCVRGTPQDNSELLNADAIRFEVYPAGCFSSSCVIQYETSCLANGSGDGQITLTSSFCLQDNSEERMPCTRDCAGGGRAVCTLENLSEGAYTVSLGQLSVSFQTGAQVDAGGLCAGELP